MCLLRLIARHVKNGTPTKKCLVSCPNYIPFLRVRLDQKAVSYSSLSLRPTPVQNNTQYTQTTNQSSEHRKDDHSGGGGAGSNASKASNASDLADMEDNGGEYLYGD